jgi:hypothetical protein
MTSRSLATIGGHTDTQTDEMGSGVTIYIHSIWVGYTDTQTAWRSHKPCFYFFWVVSVCHSRDCAKYSSHNINIVFTNQPTCFEYSVQTLGHMKLKSNINIFRTYIYIYTSLCDLQFILLDCFAFGFHGNDIRTNAVLFRIIILTASQASVRMRHHSTVKRVVTSSSEIY